MPTNVYRVEVDWEGNGLYAGADDDITSDVINAQFRRGRDYASQLTGNSTAGTLKLRLNNTTGKYSPSNAASALSGKNLPGRMCRFTIAPSSEFPYEFPFNFSTEAVQIWNGRLENVTPNPSSHTVDTCTLHALGPLGYINEFVPESDMETTVRTDEAVGMILDAVGWPAVYRDLAVGQTTMTRWWTDSNRTIDALRIVEETEGGFIKEKANGDIGFESRITRLASPFNTSQATFSDAAGATNSYMSVEQVDPLANILNEVRALSYTYNYPTLGVLWTHPETGADSPFFHPGETKTFIATYPNNISPIGAAGVSSWVAPVANTDYTCNTQSGGTGVDSTSEYTVTVSPLTGGFVQRNRMNITITNTSTWRSGFLTKLEARGYAVNANAPVTVESVDTVSQNIYGDRSFTADTRFFPSSTNAQSWCTFQNQIFGTPINFLRLNFNANVSAANILQANERDISDRITVVANNNAPLGINEDFFIEEIRHTVSNGGTQHMVSWLLSPATGGYSQFWVLGTGRLGTSTVPAY